MRRKINGFSKWLYPKLFAFGIFQTRSLSLLQSDKIYCSSNRDLNILIIYIEIRYAIRVQQPV